jgi:glycosyltransferase involved in cell wall biosynthesis
MVDIQNSIGKRPALPAAGAAPAGKAGDCGALKYCGPVFDASGYAQFARGFVTALHRLAVPVCLEAVSYDASRPDLGTDRALLSTLQGRAADYGVKIVNVNPESFRELSEPDRVNIGFTMFETTRIPSHWVRACNAMDGILVPCSWNREVFERSGVEVPVRVAAVGIDPPAAESRPLPESVASIACRQLIESPPAPAAPAERGLRGAPGRRAAQRWQSASLADCRGALRFYSIFQWTERKNGAGLLRAYLSEFRRHDRVCLILKTHGRDYGAQQQAAVAEEVAAVRDSMRLSDHAPVLLVGDLLSQDEIHALHRFGDCFVLPHRAEGVGLPHLEAMAHGKPVIATGFSGNLEFMSPANSLLLPYQLRPVTNMGPSPAYEGHMMWAEPDLAALRRALRRVYADRAYAAELGRRAREHVLRNFSWSERAKRFMDAVGQIVAVARPRSASAAA